MKAYSVLLFFIILNSAISIIAPVMVGQYNVFGLDETAQANLMDSLPCGNADFSRIIEDTTQQLTNSNDLFTSITSALTGGLELIISFVTMLIQIPLAVPILLINLNVPLPLVTLISVPLYVITACAVWQTVTGKSISFMT